MKIEGYEEISEEEYNKNPINEGLFVNDHYKDKQYYFKKAQKFPICFDDNDYMIEIGRGGIGITNKSIKNTSWFSYNNSFPLLVKAIEKAKEVAKKNDK